MHSLAALADPTRRRIVELLAQRELSAGEIAGRFAVTAPAISQHLTVLKGAGLLAERRDGTRRLYRARPEALDGMRQFLESMWASSLDVARRLAEAERGLTDEGDAKHAG